MKLTNLSVAIMVALGVVACGGSDDNNSNKPVDPPAPPAPAPDNNKPQPQPEPKNDDKIVDPTGTKVVDGRDLSKESTVGGLQYIRRDGSDFDRIYNPSKPASATPLLGVTLNEQNPKLTNIVLARRDLEREADKAVRAQFAGGTENEPLTPDGHARENPSLQVENFKNVDILAGAFKQVGSADFSKADNRLGADHNIDTHIQNNTDKTGEFTRERVEYVYTPRFEYRQPFVDYPNAEAADLEKYSQDPTNDKEFTATASERTQPLAPPLPGKANNPDELQKELMATDWSSKNNASRHPVNIGTWYQGAYGSVQNDEKLYGNMNTGTDDSPDKPEQVANLNAWRNRGTFTTADGTPTFPPATPDPEGNNKFGRINGVVDWSQGGFNKTIERTTAVTRTGALPGSLQKDTRGSKKYTYDQGWPNGGYPRFSYEMFGYPNTEYNEEDNRTLYSGTNAEDPRSHEHIYLEREKFTAIRQPKAIRPLVNPIANEWTWTLHQGWRVLHSVAVKEYELDGAGNRVQVPDPTPTDPNHTKDKDPKEYTINKVVTFEDEGDGDYYHNTVVNNLNKTGAVSSEITGERNGTTAKACGSATQYECAYTGAGTPQLQWAYWKDPKNEGGGQRGEFRGPYYIGWDQDNSVVQFSDPRIWKAGAPGYKQEYEKKYGANLIWWSTQDSAFENHATSNGKDPRARRVDRNVSGKGGEGSEDLVWGKPDALTATGTDARDRDVEIQPTGDITNGLIRIGGLDSTGKMKTLGQELIWKDGRWEDHHKTTSRIFGHYHLAWADQEKREVKDMSMNSYSGARSFVAKVKGIIPEDKAPFQSPWGGVPDLDSKADKYSIGAVPMTLKKVQYGRVTTQLDLASGEGPYGDGFLRAPFAVKGSQDSVDHYFFRGIDATSIEDMPQNGSAIYNGHALMYGINNDFHGVTGNVNVIPPKQDLPNAFDGGARVRGSATLGLGNFVEANVDFGTRKVKGDVYNAWLVNENKSTVVHDKLVAFEGDITGNTVIGKADRAYIPGNDEADFRAAFFGKQAEEMGGSFNSVKPDDKYGSAYEVGDWGGVFGAAKTGGSNTFQGDDSNNVYGNTQATGE